MAGTPSRHGRRSAAHGNVDPVGQLDREWHRLAHSPLLRARLRSWAQREPALGVFAGPAGLIRFLREPGRFHDKDAALSALLRLAPTDPLAARVVLEALMPGLKRIARQLILDSRDRDELWQLLLASACEQIDSYPLARRPARIAANLLYETRRAALSELRRNRQPHPDITVELADVAAATDVDGDVEALLDLAVAASAISQAEAELILETRIDRVALVTVAARRSASYDALRVQRRRAERRLLVFLGQPAVRFPGRKAHCSPAPTPNQTGCMPAGDQRTSR